jgi:DNA-binding transcriptional LysR family regulator
MIVVDIKRLRVLKAVVDEGSVVAAAAALAYTPSAVSQQVTALEREVGTVLLERAGRGVRPTDAALLLCRHAEDIGAAVQRADDAIAALRAGQLGRLRVGAFPTAGAGLVPQALAAFERRHPNVELDLAVLEVDDAIAALRRGNLDLAVVIETPPGSPGHTDGLVAQHLMTDPYRLVLPAGHQLARRRAVSLAELSHERWIGVTSCPGYCQLQVEEAYREAGFEPKSELEADEYTTALGFIAAGLGVALVPVLALGPSSHPAVVVRRLKEGPPVREVWSVTRPAIAGQVAVAAMVECLRASGEQVMAAAA